MSMVVIFLVTVNSYTRILSCFCVSGAILPAILEVAVRLHLIREGMLESKDSVRIRLLECIQSLVGEIVCINPA